jgi:secreted trypsin-like serine protease
MPTGFSAVVLQAAVQAVALLLMLALALLVALPAVAIVIRHDRSDAMYVVDAGQYPQLFHLHTRASQRRVCMATLIAPRWAITAAHCLDETPIAATLAQGAGWQLEVAGGEYGIDTLAVHPQYIAGAALAGVDLALIRLDREVAGITPVLINRDTTELGRVVQLFGWGHTGNGNTGRQRNDGHFRRAENEVSEALQWLSFRFDDPREQGTRALALEGIPALGDSGGPALVQTPIGLVLLGVALGELEQKVPQQEAGQLRQGRYGAIEIYERISLHLDWIEAILGSEWPAPAALTGLGP